MTLSDHARSAEKAYLAGTGKLVEHFDRVIREAERRGFEIARAAAQDAAESACIRRQESSTSAITPQTNIASVFNSGIWAAQCAIRGMAFPKEEPASGATGRVRQIEAVNNGGNVVRASTT